jgi:UDP-2,3-diacylglucosamine hydrolase
MYYFASDMHLGLAPEAESREREKLLIGWLREVARDAAAIFIVGDMFDFWYEYRRVVPKGFTRLLGTLSELTDRGVEIHFLTGNHDMWAYDYLHTECGVHVHDKPLETTLYGKRLFITHGDDITAREHGLPTRLMNGTFRSRSMRWLFSRLLHPDVALRFGHGWSAHSRKSKAIAHRFLAEEEPMVRFARRYSDRKPVDYFLFGHNHCAELYPLGNGSTAVFLGEWIEHPAYAVLDASGTITLRKYPAPAQTK